MLRNWTNIFIYQIKSSKLFTALNILGLSIGISGLIFALLYWNDEHNYNDWNPEKDHVYQVLAQLSDMPVTTNNPVRLKPHLENDPNIETVVFADEWYQKDKVVYNGQKESVDKIINVERDFFSLFPFKFIYGNAKSAIKDGNSIAISEKLSERFFGDKNPIGKQIKCFNSTFTIEAVYRVPGNSSIAPNIVVNRMKDLTDPAQNPGLFVLKILVKLKDPSKVELTRKMLEKVFYDEVIVRTAKQAGFTPAEMIRKMGSFKVFMEPLSTARLHSATDGYTEGRGNYQFLVIMACLSVLILILSIVNYINLATANSIKRAKEVGVRKVLGASKKHIVYQFIFETILITTFSILLALMIVEITLPFYNSFLEKDLKMVQGQFYLQLLIVFAVTILFAGIFPALYVSNFKTLNVLKGNYERSKSGVWFRNGMLVLQFAIAAFFIIGSTIVYRQIEYLSNKDLGFKGDQVLAVSLNFPSSYYNEEKSNQKIYYRYNTIKEELYKIKGVSKVSTGLIAFDGKNNSLWPVWYKEELFKQKAIGIDYGMLDLMKIKILQGRDFDQKLASDTTNSVLINEKALKLMNIKNPINTEIKIGNQPMKIIGVVKDFNLLSPESAIVPITFYHIKSLDMAAEMNVVYIKIEPENMQNTIADIESFWKRKVDTENPFQYNFVDKQYARTYESYVKQKDLFSLLNIVVIFIALFGLFALASYSIQRRMKEIAIRKTLGAETNILLKELSKQYILYCFVGFILAIVPAYLLLQKWLNNFAFRIEIPLMPFLLSFVLLLFLTLTIVLTKAYQATKVDVLRYLKYE
ncbi:ABC transporter permease [Flavobacterium quisquiliarum]|uniref:ABC transporter permease n=1 Tax=Flavobacterium quisquiliarum TaxID=1834436 RepID=A0ABV8W1B4_9FLAO|nr:ABC transporter permease [Flavobacterium quisquiliarum]MBW1653861.1 FtsX-like permease family protein [Flavobacterium quisquiliarum]NWL01550.1 multidrug ABC transporter substrate-binding protein [Flavobacterium collinsii]